MIWTCLTQRVFGTQDICAWKQEEYIPDTSFSIIFVSIQSSASSYNHVPDGITKFIISSSLFPLRECPFLSRVRKRQGSIRKISGNLTPPNLRILCLPGQVSTPLTSVSDRTCVLSLLLQRDSPQSPGMRELNSKKWWRAFTQLFTDFFPIPSWHATLVKVHMRREKTRFTSKCPPVLASWLVPR